MRLAVISGAACQGADPADAIKQLVNADARMLACFRELVMPAAQEAA